MSFRDPFPFLLVSPGDDDGRTLRRELVGNAESDARIAASHHRDPAFKRRCHRGSLFRLILPRRGTGLENPSA
jgi:hypothetical protein